jgi:hypothetical protein
MEDRSDLDTRKEGPEIQEEPPGLALHDRTPFRDSDEKGEYRTCPAPSPLDPEAATLSGTPPGTTDDIASSLSTSSPIRECAGNLHWSPPSPLASSLCPVATDILPEHGYDTA